MALARVHNPLGNTIITKIGDTGGPRSDYVADEIDSIITGVNTIESDVADIVDGTTRISGVRYNVVTNTSTVGTVGGGEDSLHSISIPAGSLATNGDYLAGEGGGAFANNTNVKTVLFKVDGTTQAAIQVASGTQGWVLRYKIVRLTSTSVRVNCTLECNVLRVNSGGAVTLSTGYAFQANNADEAVSNLASNALAILVTGQADDSPPGTPAPNNSITQTLSIVELVQQ